jgi:ketosteroid isomerase-like protein
MSRQLQTFLDEWIPVQIETGLAVHSGDAAPWLDVWSRTEPVSVFGAGIRARRGWSEVRRTMAWVASAFAECTTYDYDLVVADVHGDLAYTCGFERYTARRPNGDEVANELRVTQIYRRENGAWRILHRHGDHAMKQDPAG